MAEAISFKFCHVAENGQDASLRRHQGDFDGTTLRLGTTEIPGPAVYLTQIRFDRLILHVVQREGAMGLLPIRIVGGDKTALARALNRCSSRAWADARRIELEQDGAAEEFRTETCPHCAATIDVSGLARSPQTYCAYCDTLWARRAAQPEAESAWRCCDQCGYFSRPRPLTIFYFYFFILFYGFNMNRKHACSLCMRRESWLMLFGNLLFVLGVPHALVAMVRAYSGGEGRSPEFPGLLAANALAHRRRADRAVAAYQEIESRLGACAGVRFNRGMALLAAGRADEAVRAFQLALRDCPNYAPALRALESLSTASP